MLIRRAHYNTLQYPATFQPSLGSFWENKNGPFIVCFNRGVRGTPNIISLPNEFLSRRKILRFGRAKGLDNKYRYVV